MILMLLQAFNTLSTWTLSSKVEEFGSVSIHAVRALFVCLIAADLSSTYAATILLRRPPGVAAVFLSGTELEFGILAVPDQLLGIFHLAPQFSPRFPSSIPTDDPCPLEVGTCIVHETSLLGIPDGDLSLVPDVPVTMATHLLRPFVKNPEAWDSNFVQETLPPQTLKMTLNVAGFDTDFLYDIKFESFETSGSDLPLALLHRKMLNLSAHHISPNPVSVDLGTVGRLDVSIQISPHLGTGIAHYPDPAFYTNWGYGSIETTFLLHSIPEASTFMLFVATAIIVAGCVRPARSVARS